MTELHTHTIVHPNEHYPGRVTFLSVMNNCGIPLSEVARKDVPAGFPYRIFRKEELPDDHTFFNAFEMDFSNPDGYGIGPEAWFAEQRALGNIL